MTLTETLQHLTDEEAAERIRIAELLAEMDRYDWHLNARPEQLAPVGDWSVWLILAGRGYGKTRTGAEWTREQATQTPGRYAVLAPTFGDVRDTCIEGESGLLACVPKAEIENYNRTTAEVTFRNGSRIKGFSADEPDRLRGPQHHGAWCDELAAWRYPETWDQLQFGLRLGSHPRTVVTTTPRPTRLIRSLTGRDAGVVVTRGSTFDNAANLAPAALAELKARYEGTRLGRQELYAELLTDTPGALFTYANIEEHRVAEAPDCSRRVVSIDPSGGAEDDNDEQGIIVAGRQDGQGYVLADESCRLSPDGWGRRAVRAYLDYECDRIVYERNYGGDMVEAVIRTAAKDMGVEVSVKAVTASRGKQLRAEPIAALYEQGKIHHVGSLETLEDQMTGWTPDDKKSPDRLDALVWAFTELMLGETGPIFLGSI